MKRRGILLIIGIWLFVFAGIGGMAALAAEQVRSTELIVLVDTSLSLNEEAMNQEIQWMQKICGVSLGTGIQVNFLTFDAPEANEEMTTRQLLERTEITDDNLSSSLEAVSKISRSGRFTDLKGALDEALAILEEVEGSRQYIMILSDGRLDYDDNRDEDTCGKEAPAREGFCKEVKTFAGQQGCGVILVEFGTDVSDGTADGDDANGACDTDDGNDIDRYKKEINLFCEVKDEPGVFYFWGASALSDAVGSVFQKMGYPIESIDAKNQEDGTITFTLNRDYDYTIIHLMQKNPDDVEWTAKETFCIRYKNQERAIDQIQQLPYSAFVFLAESKEGCYSIDFLKGGGDEWNCELICRKKERVDVIHLSLWQDETESSEEFYPGEIILRAELEGDLDASSKPLLSYRLNYENKGFGEKIFLWSPDIIRQGRIQEKEIFIEKTGTYQIQVFGPDESVSSEIVPFTVNARETDREDGPEEQEKNAKVGEEISLRRMFNFSENERVTVSVKEEGEQSISEHYTIENEVLTFETEGRFEVTIQGSEESYQVRWIVESADEDDKRNLYQKIIDFFKNIFS